MDKVHKPITTQYYTPSSKPFRIYLIAGVSTTLLHEGRTQAECVREQRAEEDVFLRRGRK
jgi:hypothetical protein